jgi:hypothetical protein
MILRESETFMIKSSVLKIAVLVLLFSVFFSSTAFADALGFRLIVENLTTGDEIIITDGSALDGNAASNIIEFSGEIGDRAFVSAIGITTANSQGLSTTANLSGSGQLRVTLENLYSPTNEQGFFVGSVRGPLEAGAFASEGFLYNANVDVQTFAEVDDTPFGTSFSFTPDDTVSGLNLSPNFDFEPAPYSIFSIVTITSTAGDKGVGLAELGVTGTAAGFGDPIGPVEIPPITVPEPASLLLLGSGLASLGLLIRRKR